jgi:hypothetical protein
MEKENQPDISNATFLKLQDWISAIKASNLYPLLQNSDPTTQKRYLKLHIRGHASGSGTPLYNQDLSSIRSRNVQNRINRMLDGNVEIVPLDRGAEDSNPKDPHFKQDLNVTIYIDEAEAQAALDRYAEEVTTP